MTIMDKSDFDEIPDKMQQARRWILWKSISQLNGTDHKKPRKVPFYTNGISRNGKLGSISDSSQFDTLDGAIYAYNKKAGGYSGLGFCLGDGWHGVDFDNVADKHPELGYVIDEIPSYLEQSPSGTGFHAIGYGNQFDALGSNPSGIEAYAHGRYFTVTGEAIRGIEIVDLSRYVIEVLKPLHEKGKGVGGLSKHVGNNGNKVTTKTITLPAHRVAEIKDAINAINPDDRDVWVKIGQCLCELGGTGRAIFMAWSAQSSKHDPVVDSKTWDSFTGDKSGYHGVFGEAVRHGWISTSGYDKNTAPIDESYNPEIQEWNANLSEEIDYMIPFDCVQRDIQNLILERSTYPQPALAYVAAMITVAVCIGRNIAHDSPDGTIKGNMMFIGMAESGEGKDFPFKYVKKILSAVGLDDRIEGRPASGAAFFEALRDNQSMLLHIDEYGHFLNGINGKGASVYAKEVINGLTECYTSADSSIIGKRTKGVEAITIEEPNVCVFGLSTEGQIFNGLSSSDVADGSLARYMMVFGKGDMLPNRVTSYDNIIPDKIVNRLKGLIKKYSKGGGIKLSPSITVTSSNEYEDEKFKLMTSIKQKSIDCDNPMFKPFYNRIVVRALQAALLVDECTDIEILKWFVDLEIKSCSVFVKKFLHLGSDNENEKMAKILQSKIKEGGKRGITHAKLVQQTRQVLAGHRKGMLDEMIENNIILLKDMKKKGSQRSSKVYYWIK